MNDAGESLEHLQSTPHKWSEEKRKKAREYMRRYNAELKAGTRVRTPRKPKDTVVNSPVTTEAQSSPVEAPGAS